MAAQALSGRAAIIHDLALESYGFGGDHPFDPLRVRLAHELCEGRWVATGGGGYDIWRVVPRAWTKLWAAVSHQELPERVPEDWLSKWKGKSPVGLPPLMRDDPEDYPQGPRTAEITERNLRTVDEVLERVLPSIQYDK